MRADITVRMIAVVVAAVAPATAASLISAGWVQMLSSEGAGLARVLAFGLSILWAVVTAVIGARWVDITVTNGEGRATTPKVAGATSAHPDPADRLRARDRQVQTLATATASAPLTDGPPAVAVHMVETARRVTTDDTWHLVVTRGVDELATGVYHTRRDSIGQVADVHQWLALSVPEGDPLPSLHRGPWGAFLTVHLQTSQELRAYLAAPWEGRREPTGADQALLSLVAAHGATAIDHALLYAKVVSQAAELRVLSGIQRDFLRGVTHDLQSPLASIAAIAADLRHRVDGDNETSLSLEVVEHQAERLRRMVTQLLTMSRLEAGQITPTIDVFRSEAVLGRVIRSLHVPSGRMSVGRSGLDRLAVGDPDRLEQVLWAVLDNAVKYSPPGSTITVTSEFKARPAPVEVISVRDEGIGMDAETREHAFEQFYRAPQARSVAPDGSGIGLYTARHLMRLMGGDVTVTSEPGGGSTVSLYMPAEPVHSHEAESTEPPRTIRAAMQGDL